MTTTAIFRSSQVARSRGALGSRRNLRETSSDTGHHPIKGASYTLTVFKSHQKSLIISYFYCFRAQKEDFSEEELNHKNPSLTINTNFSSMQIERQEANVPYDFQKFQKVPSLKNGKIKLADYELSNKNNSVWTMDCEDGLIILGCSNGTVEIWDTLSGQLKVIFHCWIFMTFLMCTTSS